MTWKSLLRQTAASMGYEVRRKSAVPNPTPRPAPRAPSKPTRLPSSELNVANLARFLYFRRRFEEVKNLNGDIVECGVGQGESLFMFAFLIREEGKSRKLWGFDSFEGFPEPTPEDTSPRRPKKGDWNETSVYAVREQLLHNGLDTEFVRAQVTLVKGYFDTTVTKYSGGKIALLHLDVDLYASYQTTLNALYPKVMSGGAILFDEYMGTTEHLHFPGARQAIDEYLGDTCTAIQRDMLTGKYYLKKP